MKKIVPVLVLLVAAASQAYTIDGSWISNGKVAIVRQNATNVYFEILGDGTNPRAGFLTINDVTIANRALSILLTAASNRMLKMAPE